MASFWRCQNLKVAEGNFDGFVFFDNSNIEKIGDLKITKPDTKGRAASFLGCNNLKTAEGTFPGDIDFSYSGIENIGDLQIAQANHKDKKANFLGCRNLAHIPKYFISSEIFADKKLLEVLRWEQVSLHHSAVS